MKNLWNEIKWYAGEIKDLFIEVIIGSAICLIVIIPVIKARDLIKIECTLLNGETITTSLEHIYKGKVYHNGIVEYYKSYKIL